MIRSVIYVLLGLIVGSWATGEIIVHSGARMALQNRTEASSSVVWCDVFYSGDFPDNTECIGMPDLVWAIFPTCCNGAFNCLMGGIWDMMLCPAQSIYDSLAEQCVPYEGEHCPYAGNTPPDVEQTTSTTPEPPISCGTLRTGKLPYDPDCSKYINCSNGKPTLKDCIQGYIFYIPFSACLPGDVEHCALYQVLL